jgi:hypothetical protein
MSKNSGDRFARCDPLGSQRTASRWCGASVRPGSLSSPGDLRADDPHWRPTARAGPSGRPARSPVRGCPHQTARAGATQAWVSSHRWEPHPRAIRFACWSQFAHDLDRLSGMVLKCRHGCDRRVQCVV